MPFVKYYSSSVSFASPSGLDPKRRKCMIAARKTQFDKWIYPLTIYFVSYSSINFFIERDCALKIVRQASIRPLETCPFPTILIRLLDQKTA